MNGWQWWCVAGLGLLILEMLTPGFIVAVFGLGCIAPALLAALGFGVLAQWVAFAALTFILFLTLRPAVLRRWHRPQQDQATNTAALTGMVGVVAEPISVARQTGRVKCHGDDWKARPADLGQEFAAGARVRVVAVDGLTVVVRAAEQGA